MRSGPMNWGTNIRGHRWADPHYAGAGDRKSSRFRPLFFE